MVVNTIQVIVSKDGILELSSEMLFMVSRSRRWSPSWHFCAQGIEWDTENSYTVNLFSDASGKYDQLECRSDSLPPLAGTAEW